MHRLESIPAVKVRTAEIPRKSTAPTNGPPAKPETFHEGFRWSAQPGGKQVRPGDTAVVRHPSDALTIKIGKGVRILNAEILATDAEGQVSRGGVTC